MGSAPSWFVLPEGAPSLCLKPHSGECGVLEAGWGPPALISGHTPWGSSSFFASDLVSLLNSGTAGFLTQEMMIMMLHGFL